MIITLAGLGPNSGPPHSIYESSLDQLDWRSYRSVTGPREGAKLYASLRSGGLSLEARTPAIRCNGTYWLDLHLTAEEIRLLFRRHSIATAAFAEAPLSSNVVPLRGR